MTGEKPEEVELLRREEKFDTGFAHLTRVLLKLDVAELQAICRLVGTIGSS